MSKVSDVVDYTEVPYLQEILNYLPIAPADEEDVINYIQIPAELIQLFFRFLVSVNIPFEFLLPEFDISGRCGCLPASRMTMPETAADLNDRLVFRQHDVRMSRQIFDMKSETESMPEEKRANQEFRSCVF